MPTQTETNPVEDTVPKIDGELAVGSDLEFQRKWWRFSSFIWKFFALVIVADLFGCFGRGPLAHATAETPDKTLVVNYERIERFSTPSILRVNFGPKAIRDQ